MAKGRGNTRSEEGPTVVSPSPRSKVAIGFLAVVVIASLAWLGYALGQTSALGRREFLAPAIAVKERHKGYLMAHPDVVGTAVGLTEDGKPAVRVYTRTTGVVGIPDRLEGVPVVAEATGEFFALREDSKGKLNNKSKGKVSTTSRWPRPVPIGVSTGNVGECSAGTISARVKNGTTVYALSNNHVYALENSAPLGSEVLQPGRYDTNCAIDLSDTIGTLFDFRRIDFSSSANNTIDAAIALSSTANLGNATPSNGYGTPKSTPVSAFVGQSVQKYGRTTQLTTGVVTGINATVLVAYSSGTARFADQIIVGSAKPFIKAGDSGSLLVSNPGANPVGLLFAGTSSGTTAIANRIDLVLSQFGVSIDGN